MHTVPQRPALVARARPDTGRNLVVVAVTRLFGIAFLATAVTLLVTLLVLAGAAAGLVVPEADLASGLRVEGIVAVVTGLAAAAGLLHRRLLARRARLCVAVDAYGIVVIDAKSERRLEWAEIARVYTTYTGRRDHMLWIDTRQAEEGGGGRVFLGVAVPDFGVPVPGGYELPLGSLDVEEEQLRDAVRHFSGGRFACERHRIGLL